MKYPAIITDDLNHTWALASSKGPLIFIRPAYKDNESVYLHELEHVKQWYVMTLVLLLGVLALYCFVPAAAPWWPGLTLLALLMHNGLYNFADGYRLWSEVRAYRVQAMGDDAMLRVFAQSIAGHYNLHITSLEALMELRK